MIKKYNEIFENNNLISEGTVLYQIVVQGRYKNFDGGSKYYSKNVFINKPTQQDIDDFIERCCNSKEKTLSLYDLDKDTIEYKILEVTVK